MPPAFIAALTADDLLDICANNDRLTPRLKARYYAALDIQNPPPNEEIEVWLDRNEIERMVRKTKRQRKPR